MNFRAPSRLLFAVSAAAALRASGPVGAEPQRPLKPEDIVAIKVVDEPQTSPDGNVIVYSVKTADLEKDKNVTNLWRVNWDGSDNRALTFGKEKQSHPRWSPDGKWIAFLSGRGDESSSAGSLR